MLDPVLLNMLQLVFLVLSAYSVHNIYTKLLLIIGFPKYNLVLYKVVHQNCTDLINPKKTCANIHLLVHFGTQLFSTGP
jgi:hypothetical protein